MLAAAWVGRAPAPKPRKKEFVDELKGWSGVLGDSCDWVRERYGALATLLARTDTRIDEPAGWSAVSRLYADYADPLARFSAQFAAIAHEHRPRGVPHRIGDTVKSYELSVPPAVRAAMAGAPTGAGVGGVVDTAPTADAFVAAPSAHLDRYLPIALRRYASILLDKRADFDDDVRAAFDDRLAALSVHGDPDQPSRPPSDGEIRRVEGLLAAQVRADPQVRSDPCFANAYLRARSTMLRWTVEGRELTDATILFRKLDSARLDQARADARTAEREVPMAEVPAPDPGTTDDRIDATDIVTRAAAELRALPGPGSCWEREFAAHLLSGGMARMPFGDLSAAVRTAWRSAAVDGAPPGAWATGPGAAARIIDALLFMALATVVADDDVSELLDGAARRRIGARFDGVAAALAEFGGATEEVGTR